MKRQREETRGEKRILYHNRETRRGERRIKEQVIKRRDEKII
jgi:hypothetical protein